MINGTGKISQRTFWLDAGNKFVDSVTRHRKKKGRLMVAINDWSTYFNVHINQVDLRAGTEVVIKVKPTEHSTSQGFRELAIEERKCRFTHENEVCQKYMP